MNRTTKAFARLGTLAVIAGTVLSTPLALGTANAAVTLGAVVNGTATSVEDAAAQSSYYGEGSLTFTKPSADHVTITVSAPAYIPTTQGTNVTATSTTTATCNGAVTTCTVLIGDTAGEAASVFVADNTDATSATGTVKFNQLTINGCPQNGIDVAQPAGSTFGGQVTLQNCVTQGQFGTPLTVSGKYLAGGAGAVQNIVIFLDTGSNAQFSGAEPSGCTIYSSDTLDCTTDAAGNWSATVVDNGLGSPPPAEQAFLTVETRGGTFTYPSIPAAPDSEGSPPAADNPPAPQVLINFGVGSVTPSRIDMVSTKVIGPSTQNSDTFGDNPNGSNEVFAEPGDVIQNTYAVYGGCTPATPTSSCHGTKLAGISLPLTVDHGYFTPNCTIAGVTGYAECSFAATPAAGTVVGNLTNSGTSVTTNTNFQGLFTVSMAIGRDAAFDQTGYLTAKVRSGSLQPQFGGNTNAPTASGCSNSAGVLQPVINRTKTQVDITTTGSDGSYPALFPYVFHQGCYIDVQWTTDETPLNGGTAKFLVISRITNPLNNFIDSENNYSATDTGTNNIPDVGRVVKLVHITDNYGNLTSNGDQCILASGSCNNSSAAGADRVSLAKTGVGTVWDCLTGGGTPLFSSTAACTGGFQVPNPVTQPDGTVNQTDTNVLGSYLNVPLQNRYQMDADNNGTQVLCYTPGGCGANAGQNWIGVNDGTQTDKLSWTPPTTTFASFHAGAPNIATYAAGNGAAQTDTEVDAFYNQLSQPVVTFSATPGSTVPTGTAVTVVGTVVDQNGNAIVGWPVQFVRTGANESTCVPTQTGQGNLVIITNQAGVAGDTFSCNGAGVSNTSIVVTGPGGTQLAAGREAVTFTGANVGGGQTVEKPTLRITRHHRHHLVLHVATHPSLAGVTVHFYKVVNGLKIIVGSARTGGAGHAHLTLGGLRSGHRYHFDVKVVGLSNAFKSEFSKTVSKVVS